MAISWNGALICIFHREIATGFALAMTRLTELGDSPLAGLLMQWIGGKTKGNGTKAVPYDIFRAIPHKCHNPHYTTGAK